MGAVLYSVLSYFNLPNLVFIYFNDDHKFGLMKAMILLIKYFLKNFQFNQTHNSIATQNSNIFVSV